jgi:excisionase family DNA binding protein
MPGGPRALERRALDGELLDVSKGALLLGCTEKGLRRRIERREIPFRRLGGRVVFLRSELEAFLGALPGCLLEEALGNVRSRRR